MKQYKIKFPLKSTGGDPMKKIAAALCVVPLFLSLNLISVSADPSAENSVNEITALELVLLK